MPKHKKGANNTRMPVMKKLPIVYAELDIGQQYGTIKEPSGPSQFKVITINDDIKTCTLKVSVKANVRIKVNDFVLIEPLTEDENKMYQVIFKYTPEQKRILEKEGRVTKIIDPSGQTESPKEEKNDGFMFEKEAKERSMAQEMELINALFVDDI